MAPTAADTIAVLRVELSYIEPLIWRRIAVPTSMDLRSLHSVIQAAMGWLDRHLWEFATKERSYSLVIPNDPDWNGRVVNAATTKLSAILGPGVTEFGYVYDMGDNWEHQIIVENLRSAEPGASYPQFLGGECRCPPEDCGGPPGYFKFIEDISGNKKKATEALKWYGGRYNPDDISVPNIESAFKRLARRPRRSGAVKR